MSERSSKPVRNIRCGETQMSVEQLLVDRLRAGIKGHESCDVGDEITRDLRDAADEIERLTAENAGLRQFREWAEPQIVTHGEDVLTIDRLTAERDTYQTERDRLLEKLERLRLCARRRCEPCPYCVSVVRDALGW
jgi:hypothetical protein